MRAGMIPRGYARARVLAESSAHVIALAERKGAKYVLKIARGDAGPVQRERDVLEALRGTIGVPRLVDAGDRWIAMTWTPGPTLEERITRRRLSVTELERLGARLDAILAAIASAGLVHADVKPANVILPRGRIDEATLVDFETTTRIGEPYGARVTTSFAAPERLTGDGVADARADAFSLGALLFACVVGQSPFAAESREASVLRVLALEPPRLAGLGEPWAGAIAALLAKDPERRPASLAAALARRVDQDEESPPSSLRTGLALEASTEPWGSIAASLRAAHGVDEVASFDAIVRVMEPKMLGAGRARARRLACVMADLLGAEPTSRRDLDAIRADSALLVRARREAVLALLAAGARRAVVTVAHGTDDASVEIARAALAAGLAERLDVRPPEAAPSGAPLAESPALVALAAWGRATAGDLAGALDVSVAEIRAALAPAIASRDVSEIGGHYRFASDARALALLDRRAAFRRETFSRVAPAFAARFPHAHARAAKLFDLGDQPLRAAYYAWRAARGLLQASQLERAHEVIELGRGALDRSPPGQVRALLVALLDAARAQLLRWSGDLAGSAAAARAALASLPAGSAEWCDALGERAMVAGKTNDASELLAVASALRQRPAREARLSWDRACARTAVQLFYLGHRKEATALVRIFEKETTLEDGSADDARRGLSPGALVTASLYAGHLDEHLERLEDAVRAFRTIGDVRSECLYGSAIGFALSQLGAYGRAERRLRRTAELARKSGVPVLLPLTLHNLGEVLSHDPRTLREALDVESQSVDELRAEGETRFVVGSLAYRARIHAGLGDLEAAERDAREALDVGASIGGLRALLFGTLAEVMLARGRNDEALAAARTAADAVNADAPAEAGDALAVSALVRALAATGAGAEAKALARTAWRDVVRRSKRISNASLRASFLRVQEHRVLRASAR